MYFTGRIHLNNLDYESLEILYKSSLFESGLDSTQIDEILTKERASYLDELTLLSKRQKTGNLAQGFTLENLNNEQVSLKRFQGKVILLNFWAGWCAPCLVEMPILVELKNEFSNYPFDILSVNIGLLKNTQEYYEKFISEYQINFILLKANDSILSQYQIPPIPKTYVIDKKGFIRFEHSGTSGSLYDRLKIEIKELLR
jgi:peroxiredoxin